MRDLVAEDFARIVHLKGIVVAASKPRIKATSMMLQCKVLIAPRATTVAMQLTRGASQNCRSTKSISIRPGMGRSQIPRVCDRSAGPKFLVRFPPPAEPTRARPSVRSLHHRRQQRHPPSHTCVHPRRPPSEVSEKCPLDPYVVLSGRPAPKSKLALHGKSMLALHGFLPACMPAASPFAPPAHTRRRERER
jgi:hypothetical protein